MKTMFAAIGTVVTSAFMNSLYNTDGGHKHDGIDKDGHAGKITDGELDVSAVEYLSQKVTTKVRNAGSIIGQIIAYGGQNIPRGFLLCDGGEVSRQDFPEYAAWADENAPYLTANSRVVKPDLRGLFLLGADGSDYVLGDRGGEKEVTLGVGTLPYHTHRAYANDSTADHDRLGSGGEASNDRTVWLDAENNWGTDDETALKYRVEGGQAIRKNPSTDPVIPHNNMPPYFVVRYLIRAYTEVEE